MPSACGTADVRRTSVTGCASGKHTTAGRGFRSRVTRLGWVHWLGRRRLRASMRTRTSLRSTRAARACYLGYAGCRSARSLVSRAREAYASWSARTVPVSMCDAPRDPSNPALASGRPSHTFGSVLGRFQLGEDSFECAARDAGGRSAFLECAPRWTDLAGPWARLRSVADQSAFCLVLVDRLANSNASADARPSVPTS